MVHPEGADQVKFWLRSLGAVGIIFAVYVRVRTREDYSLLEDAWMDDRRGLSVGS